MLICEVYAAVTLTITAIWIYSARTYSLSTLAWAMFFPGLFAPWFNEDYRFKYLVLGWDQSVWKTVQYTVLGVLTVVIILSLVYLINYMTGWAEHSKPGTQRVELQASFRGFLRAAGEEVGWRCYLLPCLLTHYSTTTALFYSGLVWGAYHLPVMILLTSRLQVRNRWRTVIVQALQCVLSAFPHGYVAIHSGFSVWAPAVMHFTWNVLNPWLYGSVYIQTPGCLQVGELWLINGEGLAGCLALAILTLVITYISV